METGQESLWLKSLALFHKRHVLLRVLAFIQICLESFCVRGIVLGVYNSRMSKAVVPVLKYFRAWKERRNDQQVDLIQSKK